MSTRSRPIAATPEQVWAVLADGWLYPLFVVGASRMRDVDDDWPAVGARLHHSVGTWPLLIDDTTEVLEVEPGRRLVLLARGWPAGEANVEFTLEPPRHRPSSPSTRTPPPGPGCWCPSRCATSSSTSATPRPCSASPTSWRVGRRDPPWPLRRGRGRRRAQRPGRGQRAPRRGLERAGARGAAHRRRRGPQRPRAAPRLRARHVQRVLPPRRRLAGDHLAPPRGPRAGLGARSRGARPPVR